MAVDNETLIPLFFESMLDSLSMLIGRMPQDADHRDRLVEFRDDLMKYGPNGLITFANDPVINALASWGAVALTQQADPALSAIVGITAQQEAYMGMMIIAACILGTLGNGED